MPLRTKQRPCQSRTTGRRTATDEPDYARPAEEEERTRESGVGRSAQSLLRAGWHGSSKPLPSRPGPRGATASCGAHFRLAAMRARPLLGYSSFGSGEPAPAPSGSF